MTELIDYISGLTITQGEGVDQPFRVLDWQRRFLEGAFAVKGPAALSIGRGNGKSTLISAVGCAAINGPLRQRRADVVVVAASFDQARVIFDHC